MAMFQDIQQLNTDKTFYREALLLLRSCRGRTRGELLLGGEDVIGRWRRGEEKGGEAHPHAVRHMLINWVASVSRNAD